jgi:hypothetical protein
MDTQFLERILKLPGIASPEGAEAMSDGYMILGENIETTGDSFTIRYGNYETWLQNSSREYINYWGQLHKKVRKL